MARIIPIKRTPRWQLFLRYLFLALIVYALLFGYQTLSIYTDWLWFGEMQQLGVFRTSLWTRLQLFFGFGLLFFLICYSNLWLAQRLNDSRPRPRMLDVEREQLGHIARRATHWGSLGGSIFLAFLVAGNAATHWPDYLQFTHAGRFGEKDPVFHKDIGFYVFRLPFWSYLQGWFVFTLFITTVGTAIVHWSDRAIDFVAGNIPTFTHYVRQHLLALLGLLALAYAMGYPLARYELLYADNDIFFGAGYTDLHARLPALHLQTAAMLLTAVLCFVNIWVGRAFRLPLVGLGLWIIVSLVGAGIWPGMMQRFTVVPNQFEKEKTYIARDIEFTRKAYALDRVKEIPFPGGGKLSAADLTANQPTIQNIRLWDWPQLGQIYTVKQALRKYYQFTLPSFSPTTSGDYNIDIDRYRLGQEYRQVMLAARELNPDNLPPEAHTWQNQRLQYTHGYGVVMSPVNRVDAEGLPEYFLSGIPVMSTRPELKIDVPQIYYGELTNDYVFVNTRQNEFDYPAAEGGNKETRYTGTGGVQLGNYWRRLAWSIRLGDANMLLSGDLTPESRLLYRRNIRERVQRVAPFLNWDNDPYLVVSQGRLLWFLDGYTLTDRYPYAKPFSAGTGASSVRQTFNYIRNSVKAVVDAYHGTVTLYIFDEQDPILKTWNRIFPGLLKPKEQMPENLRAHLRYPEDLFRIQRDIYTLYHIQDPRVYYGKEDVWSVPTDPSPAVDDDGNMRPDSIARKLQPYYLIMRLPGEKEEEFLIMTPFTPLGRENVSAWMCAKCDPEDYGQLLVYRFPKGLNINGPQQIMNQIKADPQVSQFQTLMGQRGSRVIFGNLLVIPVEKSLLYAVPVYVQAAGTGSAIIPAIKQVIVASEDRIEMQPTLDQAIAALASGAAVASASPPSPQAVPSREATPTPSISPTPSTPGETASPAELVRRAAAAYERARQKQREYDSALEDLGKVLEALKRSMGGQDALGR
jgi:uncharacterized membrane protein (UPF0182 family)